MTPHRLLKVSLILPILLVCACLPPVEEQKTMIRKNEIRLRALSSQAFIETWGPPAYERREVTQFFVTGNGYVPRFRVSLGEPPAGWNSEVISGEAYFLAYPDRGELLGFLQEEVYVLELFGLQKERLIYREHLPAEQIHLVGKAWQREDRFKTGLESPQGSPTK